MLARTTFGRSLYAIGHNETAARFSGIPVDRYKLIIYTLSGLMAGLAGCIFVSRVSTTRSDMGTGLELDVIAAVVLGGTSIFGGIGTIAGTVLGLILIQLLKNGLALTGVKGDATIVVIGAVLILSILITKFASAPPASERLMQEPDAAGKAADLMASEGRYSKTMLMITDCSAVSRGAALPAGGAGRRTSWDGADDLPINPLACDGGGRRRGGGQGLRRRPADRCARPGGQADHRSSTCRS